MVVDGKHCEGGVGGHGVGGQKDVVHATGRHEKDAVWPVGLAAASATVRPPAPSCAAEPAGRRKDVWPLDLAMGLELAAASADALAAAPSCTISSQTLCSISGQTLCSISSLSSNGPVLPGVSSNTCANATQNLQVGLANAKPAAAKPHAYQNATEHCFSKARCKARADLISAPVSPRVSSSLLRKRNSELCNDVLPTQMQNFIDRRPQKPAHMPEGQSIVSGKRAAKRGQTSSAFLSRQQSSQARAQTQLRICKGPLPTQLQNFTTQRPESPHAHQKRQSMDSEKHAT